MVKRASPTDAAFRVTEKVVVCECKLYTNPFRACNGISVVTAVKGLLMVNAGWNHWLDVNRTGRATQNGQGTKRAEELKISKHEVATQTTYQVNCGVIRKRSELWFTKAPLHDIRILIWL